MTRPEEDAARAERMGRPISRFLARGRRAIRRHPALDVVYRIVVTVLGSAIALVGLVMVPLPGPGWLVVFVGLAVLGSEYRWARRLLGWLRRALARFWERWNMWRADRRTRKEASRRARDAHAERARASRVAF